jgi:hypothetical protein
VSTEDCHHLFGVRIDEPRLVFRRDLGRSSLGVAHVPLQHAALYLEPLELLGRRAGQVLYADVVAEDSLVAGELHGKTLDLEAQLLAHVDHLALAQQLEVWHHHRVQALLRRLVRSRQSEHAQLLDEGRLQVMCLNFLGIDVLA